MCNTPTVIIAIILGTGNRSALIVVAYSVIQTDAIAAIFRTNIHPALIISAAFIAIQADVRPMDGAIGEGLRKSGLTEVSKTRGGGESDVNNECPVTGREGAV